MDIIKVQDAVSVQTPHNILLSQGGGENEQEMGVRERNLTVLADVEHKITDYLLNGVAEFTDLQVVLTDKEKKKTRKCLKTICTNYENLSESFYQGKAIAVVVVGFNRKKSDGMVNLETATITFHDGRSISMIFNPKTSECDTKFVIKSYGGTVGDSLDDFVTQGERFLSSHFSKLGKSSQVSSRMIFSVAQQEERFSNLECDETVVAFCWTCYVEVKDVAKSLCGGCKKARYCTVLCQGYDRERHEMFCQKMLERRRNKMIKRSEKELAFDNIVD